jgi:outer membrane lipoprotein LolB
MPLKARTRLLGIITSLLLLCSCSTLAPETQLASQWLQHQQQLKQLTNWTLKGRVALFTQDSRRSANLFWKQAGEQSQMKLTGPLGTDILSLEFNPERVLLVAEGQTHEGQEADTLLWQLTGWNIPVSNLKNWLKGLPGEHAFNLNEAERLAQVTSNSNQWQVSYASYQRVASYILPRQLTIVGQQTRIKLSINQWQIN